MFGEDTIAEKVGSYISTALNLKTLAQQKLIDYFAFNLHETTEDQNLNAEEGCDLAPVLSLQQKRRLIGMPTYFAATYLLSALVLFPLLQ